MADPIRWTIAPLVGLGPLRFGMSPQQVGPILDPLHPVSASHPAFDGSVNEFRSMDLPVCSYMGDALHSIDTGPLVKVFWQETDVYQLGAEAVLQLLERANGGARTDLGMVIFERIGVNTSGFYRPDEKSFVQPSDSDYANRGLAVFQQGAFDALLPDFKAISFL